MIAARERWGELLPSALRIGVISQRYATKSIYRRLGIREARLIDAIPAAVLSRSGQVWALRSGRGEEPWKTIFTSGAANLRLLDKHLDLVIFEHPLRDLSSSDALSLPGANIHIFYDPADPTLAKMADTGMPIFTWDAEEVRACGDPVVVDGPAGRKNYDRLRRIAKGIDHRILAIPAARIAENSALFWQDVGPLVSESRQQVRLADLCRCSTTSCIYVRSRSDLRPRRAFRFELGFRNFPPSQREVGGR